MAIRGLECLKSDPIAAQNADTIQGIIDDLNSLLAKSYDKSCDKSYFVSELGDINQRVFFFQFSIILKK